MSCLMAARALLSPIFPCTTSRPVKGFSALYLPTSANFVLYPYQPLQVRAKIKEQLAAICLSLLPCLEQLIYRDGVTPPSEHRPPPERAGESTRTLLYCISPEKLALPHPARGAPRASSLARPPFEGPEGGRGDQTCAPAPARQSSPLPLLVAFLASEKNKPLFSPPFLATFCPPAGAGGGGGAGRR